MRRDWLIIFMLALFVSVGADLWFPGEQGHGAFSWSRVAGFFALFGFIGCVAIIIFSKLLGRFWLQREEDYYRDEGHE